MSLETRDVFVPITDTPPVPPAPIQALGCEGGTTHTHAKLDRLGIWFSAICAVHCMVLPIILISFPVLSWAHWSRLMDAVVLGVAAVFGLGGCLLGMRHHQSAAPLALVVVGLALNTTGRFGASHLGAWLAGTLVISGPMVMAYGLWRDRQLCKCRIHGRVH